MTRRFNVGLVGYGWAAKAHLAALLLSVVLPVAGVRAAEPMVFHPAYAPAPADNPLKGFVPPAI